MWFVSRLERASKFRRARLSGWHGPEGLKPRTGHLVQSVAELCRPGGGGGENTFDGLEGGLFTRKVRTVEELEALRLGVQAVREGRGAVVEVLLEQHRRTGWVGGCWWGSAKGT